VIFNWGGALPRETSTNFLTRSTTLTVFESESVSSDLLSQGGLKQRTIT